jgi:holin-like protein
MLLGLIVLLACQLVGELVARLVNLPLPGPLLGATLLFGLLRLRPGLAAHLRPVAPLLLVYLPLLFVPAGTGVMVHGARVQAEWLPITAALVLSTLLGIGVSAVVFRLVAHWAPAGPEVAG